MGIIYIARTKKQTHLFNANQKIFIRWINGGSGGNCEVVAKHRGNGNYIRAWVKQDNICKVQLISVNDDFMKRLNLYFAENMCNADLIENK